MPRLLWRLDGFFRLVKDSHEEEKQVQGTGASGPPAWLTWPRIHEGPLIKSDCSFFAFFLQFTWVWTWGIPLQVLQKAYILKEEKLQLPWLSFKKIATKHDVVLQP